MLSDLQVGVGSSYAVAGIATVVVVAAMLSRPSKLDAIPTVGSSGRLSSWRASLTFLTNKVDVFHQGYEKYKSAPFKVAEPHGWLVVLSSRQHIEDVRRAPEDTLSFTAALNDQMYIEYTLGPEVYHNPYHISIVRSQLTRNIAALYPDTRDEIVTAFDDVLDLDGNEWKSIPALKSAQKIVCRAANRAFVGLPLCRDPDWIDLNVRYPIDLFGARGRIMLFPNVLKPIVARYFTNVGQSKERAKALVGVMIEERLQQLNKYGKDWPDKPRDVLTWLMDEVEDSELSTEALAMRLLGVNLGAVHTTFNGFTHALIYLAANPEYVRLLREEVEGIVDKEGWTKASVDKMRKTDSFLKECLRMRDNASIHLLRKALKDFVLSDGTVIPKGTTIAAPGRSIHGDEAVYENAHGFEPFRFSDLREEDGEGVKHRFASTAPEYLVFGHGRHACPGRFFAANVLKSMVAHVVVTYDIRLEDDVNRPKAMRFATDVVMPDPRVKVMFRRRVD